MTLSKTRAARARQTPLRGKVKPGLSTRLAGLVPYLFISPAYLLFTVFILLPLLATVAISFLNWPLLGTPHATGLKNYVDLVHDSVALKALRNTFLFTILTAAAHLIIALALAMGVRASRSRIVQYFVRTAFVAPFLMSGGVVALMWGGLMNHDFGPIAYYLEKLGFNPPDFLNSKVWVIPSLVVVDLWQTIGITFIFMLVGLQSIPAVLYEAARVDGASAWNRFVHVTLPMLSPTALFAIVISFIGAFQTFTWMEILTNGGPGNSSLSMVQYVYRSAFQNFQLGYGSTIGVMTLVVLLLFTLVQFGISRWWVHYERM